VRLLLSAVRKGPSRPVFIDVEAKQILVHFFDRSTLRT